MDITLVNDSSIGIFAYNAIDTEVFVLCSKDFRKIMECVSEMFNMYLSVS